jgi:uncharacterized protein with von Willebrand factor type A (vWA) domain
MIKTQVTVDEVIEVLNEALRLDPQAMNELIAARIPCNEKLADHPTIQVGMRNGGVTTIGPLGLLNGLFGVQENGYGPISVRVESDLKTIVCFERSPK